MTDQIRMLSSLFESFFQELRIRTWESPLSLHESQLPDYGLRSIVTLQPDPLLPEIPLSSDSEFHLCMITDHFLCHYIALTYAGMDHLLLIGPYQHAVPATKDILQIFRSLDGAAIRLSSLRSGFEDIPLVTDAYMLEAYLRASIRTVFPSSSIHFHEISLQSGTGVRPVLQPEEDDKSPERLQALDQRYHIEQEMIEAVERGDLENAQRKLSLLGRAGLRSRSGSTVRDAKDYLIVINTLCRRAAFKAGIHPYYIDRLSGKLNLQIENCVSYQEMRRLQLQSKIIRQYCMLIRNQSTAGFSPAIRKVMNYISIHENEPLTLAGIAQATGMNRGYLSGLFHKETGETLTDYLHARKIRNAIFLMNTGRTNISEIASLCGFDNVNYFTRLFGKVKGMPPTAYLKMLEGGKETLRSE